VKPLVSMRAALGDPDLLGRAVPGESWSAWRTMLIAIMGEELDEAERAVWRELTGGREAEPGAPVEEFFAVVGRRSGKTRAAATAAVYLAVLCDHSGELAPGERGVLPILSATTWQATRALNLIRGIFSGSPALGSMIESETQDTLRLSTNVDIECRPASFRTIRGATAIAFICDELGFWFSQEQARNPDSEILAAARPALATLGGPLLCVSSPYGKRGELWGAFKRDYGYAGDPKVVVINAASRRMNATLSAAVVDRAYARDPQAARAEFGGEFRTDISGFLDFALVDAAVDVGVTVRPPRKEVIYRSSCDPSGGAHDAFALAIAHDDADDIAVLDCLVEIRSPFNPTTAVADMAGALASYGLSSTTGDKYAAGWVVDAFAKVGVKYEHSERNRSEAYLDVLPLFTAGRVRLLDNPRLVAQFAALERRTGPTRDRVDHGPGGHDDLCNAAALALSGRPSGYLDYDAWVGMPSAAAGEKHVAWSDLPYFARIGGLGGL
jgi:hypothetical protein